MDALSIDQFISFKARKDRQPVIKRIYDIMMMMSFSSFDWLSVSPSTLSAWLTIDHANSLIRKDRYIVVVVA